MKRTKENFNHIVDLLANGLSDILGIESIDFDELDYKQAKQELLDLGYEKDEICREDVWAQILFDGKPLLLTDEEDDEHKMFLKNIESQNIDWEWLEDNGDFYDNNAILQKAIFGEVVYG